MSATGYENQLMESIKELKEEGREAKKIVRRLTKKRRKGKLSPSDEEVLAIYTADIEYIKEELIELDQELRSINFKEEHDL